MAKRLAILAIAAGVLAACGTSSPPTPTPTQAGTPTATPVRTPTPLPTNVTGATPTPTGEGILWPPVLERVVPASAAPGAAVTVIGKGGYVEIDGGYDESSRDFELSFDGEPVGRVNCFVNHCQGSIIVPATATPGEHRIAAEGGSSVPLTVN